MLYLLDYGAGNVKSLANSIRKLGYEFEWVRSPQDIDKADRLLFPGVGAFGSALESLRRQGYAEPLKRYIASGKPYMGICIGMQALFESSTEAPGIPGLAVVPGQVSSFDAGPSRSSAGSSAGSSTGSSTSRDVKSVPHMGWNEAKPVRRGAEGCGYQDRQHFYFVHSYRVQLDAQKHEEWALTTTQYGDEVFLSSIRKGNVFATQFHPEKSGRAGLEVLRAWLSGEADMSAAHNAWLVQPSEAAQPAPQDGLTKRVVACLDVRSNDDGDLVVTKGESYDVREKQKTEDVGGQVRNLGKPVDLALRYYLEGADEIVFLNITSFRACPLQDQPMLSVLSNAAASIFVPLTIGGGIKDSVDPDGTKHSAQEVANEYFRAGADKVSIGSEAVLAVEELLERAGSKDVADVKDENLTGKTGIEQISTAYGKQAVVVSIDPRRVYVDDANGVDAVHKACLVYGEQGGAYEGRLWWYRCTIKGGREDRDLDVVQLAKGVERLGAGEVLVNSIDQDGQSKGFDRQLIDMVRASVSIPVVASSGAGSAKHFEEVFQAKPLPGRSASEGRPSSVEAALAAGIFHRKQVGIDEVKAALADAGFKVRRETIEEGASAIVQKATERERQ